MAVALGVGLGGYAAGEGPVGWQGASITPALADSAAQAPLPPEAPSPGPAHIHCTGCGPTLEERRMAADMAGLDAGDGTYDPYATVARDEGVQEEATHAAHSEPAADSAPIPASKPTPRIAVPPPVRATTAPAAEPTSAEGP
ncbi:MAG: hypothetical protein AB7E60_09760 [Sphingobium sp.]